MFMGRAGDKVVTTSVEALRENNMIVALDDFGTGYASLTHLLEFPVDLIKIDQSFVQRLCHDLGSMAIVSALLDIANKLDMHIVAEGVETRDQAVQLCRMGCTLAQGFYYSRAVSFEEATALLETFGQGILRKPVRSGKPGSFAWPEPAFA